MNQPLRALIVEDSEQDALLLVHELQRGAYDVSFQCVNSAATLTAALAAQPWDLVLSDYRLPQFTGLHALQLVRRAVDDLPFILVSGVVGEDTAVGAMKAGANDYVLKDNLARLLPAVERELRDAHVRHERRQAEERYRTVFNSMTEGFALHEIICNAQGDPIDYRFLDLNPAFERLTGLTRTAVLGRTFREVLPAEDWSWVELYGNVARTGEPVTFERSSLQRHFEVYAFRPVPHQFAVIFRDITPRKQAAQELRTAEEQLRLAVEGADLGTWMADLPAGLSVSRRGRELFGLPPDQPLDRAAVLAALHEDDRPKLLAALDSALTHGDRFVLELRVVLPDATTGRWLSLRGQPIGQPGGSRPQLHGIVADITARKKTEAERAQLLQLVEAEAVRWQTTVENIPGALVVCDASARPTFYNAEFAQMFDQTLNWLLALEDQVVGVQFFRPDGTQFGPTDLPVQRAALFGEPQHNVEVIRRGPGAAERIMLWNAAPLPAADGRITGAVAIGRDITAQRHAEATLRASEQRERQRAVELATMLRAMPATVWIADSPDCRHIVANRFAEQILQVPAGTETSLTAPREIRPTNFKILKDGVELAGNDLPVQRAARGETIENYECTLRLPDGTERHLLGNATPLLDETGAPRGAMAAFVDITDRKFIEEALRASEARYRSLIELCPDPIFVSRNNQFALVNAATVDLFGATRPADLLGKSPLEFLHPDFQDSVHRRIRRVLAGESVPTMESKIIRLDGGVRDVEVSATRLLDRAGPALLVIMRDITERKLAERALLEAHETLEQRVRDRTAALSAANRELERGNLALQMVGDCNEALVRATSESELLHAVCRIITQVGGYRLSWVGFAEPDKAKSVKLVAWAGHCAGYLKTAKVTWADRPRGRGPTGTAIRTGQVVVCGDFKTDPRMKVWRNNAAHCGFASSIGLPLLKEGRPFGALTIYAGEPNAFGEREQRLLQELAHDLAFGINMLRLRAERARLEQQVLAISEREQRRIGHDLHDGVGQHIAGVGYMAAALAQRLADRGQAESAAAAKIAELMKDAVQQVRDLSRGLHPVKLDPEGLMDAFRALALQVSTQFKLDCRFDCPRPVCVADNLVATNLYRLAQEAVRNACVHGKPRHVRIQLAQQRGQLKLTIEDDGCGLPHTPRRTGLGLSIMQYRAASIGAELELKRGRRRGTLVACTMKLPNAKNGEVAS